MKIFTRISLLVTAIIVAIVSTGCTTTGVYTVFVTPPNYGIVIDLDNPSSQITANNFDNGRLMDVTQQEVIMKRCSVDVNNRSNCPNVMVIEVPGAFITRVYTAETNSGTSSNKESLCFEASGANGCVDFTVTATVLKKNAICYANRVGIVPFSNGDEARFHFRAIPLGDWTDANGKEMQGTMDTRVVGKTSGIFSEAVVKTSPLTLALDKYKTFSDIKKSIVDEIFNETCITLDPKTMYISNGIVWKDQAIQDQINQATVLSNQLELLARKNDLLKQQTQALLDRTQLIEKQYGLPAALEFMRIQTEQMKIEKWDGNSWLPFINPSTGQTVVTPGPITPTPAPKK